MKKRPTPLRGRWKALILALFVGLAFGFVQIADPLERTLQVARNKLRSHPASGGIVLVGIDDRSVGEMGSLPWTGTRLAQLVQAVDAAGVRRIHLESDLSQLGGEVDAARLERALSASRAEILLPSRFSVGRLTGERTAHLPPDRFARHARLVNTNLLVYWDGAVWQHPYGALAANRVSPSLASVLAGRESLEESLFPVDHAIDVRSVPVVSASDLLQGRVPARRLAGRQVVIGRTDLDADLYRAPGTGLIPAVYFHIAAAETLIAGTPVDLGWLLPLLPALAVAVAILWIRRRSVAAAIAGTFAACVLFGPVLLEEQQVRLEVLPAFAIVCTVAIIRLISGLRRSYRARGMTNLLTGLPNLEALRQAGTDQGILVAARVRNYAQITASLPPACEKELVEQIIGRLEFGASGATTYQADEGLFVWVAENVAEDDLVQQVEGLHALFRSPIVIGSRLIDVAVTFGIDVDADRPLAQRASSALVAADEAARDGKRWASFNPASAEEADWRLSLLARLDHAIEHDELWVAYQPKLDCRTGRWIGAEALVRWTHPERGQLYPDQFIAAAEQGGRIDALTWFVLDTALRDTAPLNRRGRRFTIAVNLSVLMLDSPSLVPTVETMLRRHRMPAEALTLEVTETSTLGSGASQIANLQRLADLGVQLSIDDYGTGFSTLEYLKRIPAAELKIDRSFVGMLENSQSDRIMVNSTIQLAHSLGRRVVAEGVENQEILEELKRMRCDVAQGFHIGRPMPFDQLRERMATPARSQAA